MITIVSQTYLLLLIICVISCIKVKAFTSPSSVCFSITRNNDVHIKKNQIMVDITTTQFHPQKQHPQRRTKATTTTTTATKTQLFMAQITESQAKKSIDKVVSTLRKDKQTKSELGNLTKVNNILGYGSPKPNTIAVRFNASFQKGGGGGGGLFGLGQSKSNKSSEGKRGAMVGQVKALLDEKSGKVLECSVFRDLGYGRAFNLKC